MLKHNIQGRKWSGLWIEVQAEARPEEGFVDHAKKLGLFTMGNQGASERLQTGLVTWSEMQGHRTDKWRSK